MQAPAWRQVSSAQASAGSGGIGRRLQASTSPPAGDEAAQATAISSAWQPHSSRWPLRQSGLRSRIWWTIWHQAARLLRRNGGARPRRCSLGDVMHAWRSASCAHIAHIDGLGAAFCALRPMESQLLLINAVRSFVRHVLTDMLSSAARSADGCMCAITCCHDRHLITPSVILHAGSARSTRSWS